MESEVMIRTKIAQIISPTTFVLAAGTLQGVKEGMEFIIYELSDPIFDPDTKEPLGQIELHKGRVKVVNAQEKVSQAITLRKKVYQDPIWDMLPGLRWTEIGQERLPIEQGTGTATVTELKVRIGDLVRNVDA